MITARRHGQTRPILIRYTKGEAKIAMKRFIIDIAAGPHDEGLGRLAQAMGDDLVTAGRDLGKASDLEATAGLSTVPGAQDTYEQQDPKHGRLNGFSSRSA